MAVEERFAGILLHPTSLPGKYGIGSLGVEAFRFVDWLSRHGQKLWQILPLGPTGWSHSPYQCYSAFAGNPDLIDLDLLVADGLLKPQELVAEKPFHSGRINFRSVLAFREPLLEMAFQRFRKSHKFNSHDYRFFWNIHSWWLESWSLFYACRKNITGKDWSTWNVGLQNREESALFEYYTKYQDDVEYQRFLQFLFFKQWFALKKHANEKGIRIFGDIPLYVSYDSSDVWSNQDIFLLDEKRKPTLVGGVPPDYFSETGQLWGNPLFDWDKLQQRGYDWWLARIHFNLNMFDLVRIDHFRGLESFWAVPKGEKTAINGHWMKAHGDALLKSLQSQIGHLPIIAEDLGTITDEVHHLRQKYNLPGMKVLQFAFADDATNEHLPHNHRTDFAVYTGTHDNDTTAGWLQSLKKEEAVNLYDYLGNKQPDRWTLIRMALASVAQIAVIPMQDILGLDTKARMNTPGTVKNNWLWRMPTSALQKKDGEKLLKMARLYGR
jgi:4-alpha-glucanotransferase